MVALQHLIILVRQEVEAIRVLHQSFCGNKAQCQWTGSGGV